MNQRDLLDNISKRKKEIKKELFFILDYKIKDHSIDPESKVKIKLSFLEEFKNKISGITACNIIKIDSGIIKKEKIQYDVFKVLIESNEDERELYLYFEYNNKKYEIFLKIGENKIYFIFDMEIKEYEYSKYLKKINYTGHKFLHQISKLDKLINFKKIIKKINYEEKQEILIKQSLIYSKEKSYHFLLNLFCKSKDLKTRIEIINYFYNNISLGEPSLFEDEEKDTIKDYMDKVEKNPNLFINFESLSKVKFYSFIIYYKILYSKNEIYSYIEKLYNDKEYRNILFEILKEYNNHLSKYLNLKIDIIEDLIKNTANEYETLKAYLKYVSNIEYYLKIINDNIEKIYEFYNFKNQITIPNNILKGRNEIEKICEYINNINNFQLKKSQNFVKFDEQFWYIYLNEKELKRPNKNNIQKLLLLHKCLLQYFRLNDVNSEKCNSIPFSYYKSYKISKDIFAQILDRLITKMINNEGEEKLLNKEKIDFLLNKNPYYMDENWKDKRNPDIFKEIDIFEEDIQKEMIKINNLFIQNNYEKFINIIFEKVDNFMKFKKLFILVDNDKECNSIFKKMNEKFEELLNKIKLSNQEDIIQITDIILSYIKLIIEKKHINEVKTLLENISKKEDKNFEEIIFLNLFKNYNEIDLIKNYITNWAKGRIKNIYEGIDSFDNIMNLVKLLQSHDLKIFFDELNTQIINEKDIFNESSFNKKLKFINSLKINNIHLYEHEFFIENNKFIKKINEDIKKNNICYNDLINLMGQKEGIVLEKLKLLDIENPVEQYKELKSKKDEIKLMLDNLNEIKDNLLYHKNSNKTNIENITKIIEKIQKEEINKINKLKQAIDKEVTLEIKDKINKVKKVKNLKIFKILYNSLSISYSINDEDNHFNQAYQKLDNLKIILNEPEKLDLSLSKYIQKEKDINEIIDELINYFNLNSKVDNLNIKKLKLFLTSEKYLNIIKYINFFFETIPISDEEKSLSEIKKIKDYYETFKKYNYEKIINDLNYLKKKEFFDYERDNNNDTELIKFFKYFYNKKESLIFLIEKDSHSAMILKENLVPDNNLDLEDIQNFIQCLEFFKKIWSENIELKQFLLNLKTKIKEEPNIINCFKKYSNNYESIIKLDSNFNLSQTNYHKIKEILRNSIFRINKTSEEFYYFKDDEKKEIKIEELLEIKNDLYVKVNEDRKKEKNIIIQYGEFIEKLSKILFYFKNLRNKGCPLNISIEIEITEKYNEKNIKNNIEYNIKYKLVNKNINKIAEYEYIINYLSRVLEEMEKQLNEIYKDEKYKYIRYIYGQQFFLVIDHINGFCEIKPILEFCLNDFQREEGNPICVKESDDEIAYYNIIIKNVLQSISKYLETVFESNNFSLRSEKRSPYSKILIKEEDFNGIFTYKNDCDSNEEKIIDLFFKLTRNMPMAQNILKCSEETSYEEMFAYFHRAILCDYKTLFIIEVNDSLSPKQNQNIYNILKNVLDYIKKEKREINSLILFLYQNEDHELIRYIERQKSKSNKKQINLEEKINQIKVNEFNEKYNNIIKNTKIFYSNVCGCGKSSLIKIKAKEKKYIYFPLGGFLTKKIIFEKLTKIIEKITDQKNTVIHLDLYDTEQDYLLTDFLFSFLITKFYSYYENILSIPLDIQIFIEIPNEFYNFLDRYKILKYFIKKNKDPEIKLNSIKANFELSKEYNINSFLNFAKTGKKSEEDLESYKIKDFLFEYIGIENPSYYQIEIFCKCISFINKKDNNFILDSKKVFEWTKLFTESIYSNFIKNDFINEKKEENINTLMEKLTEIDNEINKNKENEESYPLILLKNPKIYEFNNGNFKIDEEPNILLENLKNIMSLDNLVKVDNNNLRSLKKILGNYIINNDNFVKMALIFYRIKAKIPVIIMGETGCGKTSLIKKLNQFQNNGDLSSLEIFNIHSGITEQDIIKKMSEINSAQKKNEIWLFFDEINTCKSMGLLSEIFCKRSFDGIKLKKNVILLGACNPYRISSKTKPQCGLIYNKETKFKKDLVYLVNPLPFSLMNFVYYFKNINQKYENEYIKSILSENGLLKNNGNMTIELITFSHNFIKQYGDISSVSLREINRFSILVNFFEKYYNKKIEFLKKERKNEKIIEDETILINSIILGIYVSYYIRLFNSELRDMFCQKANTIINKQKIKNKIDFIDIPNEEKNFIINEIELEAGIGKNNILKENIFLMFIAINTRIPLIICGKPGCSKSLSFQLIFKSMLGQYSKSIFFRYFPSIIRSCFQGSITTSSKAVSKLFEIAKEKLEKYKKSKEKLEKEAKENNNEIKMPISLVYFDELGLAEKSKENPLKVLHSKLELDLNENEDEKIGFIGISNWSLDSAKMNRAITLFVPELDNKIEDIRDTMISIVENINSELYEKYEKVFIILSESYYQFKKYLRKKSSKYFDKLGCRDFYHLIRYSAGKINSIYIKSKNKNKILSDKIIIAIIRRAIERNFSGFEFDDIEKKAYGIENSVILFKQKYNKLCKKKDLTNMMINIINNKYEIIERIRENLSEDNCRYLMLNTKLSMQSFILDNILSKIENKIVIEKSPFNGDNTSDYLIDTINRIKNSISKGDILILIDLEGIFDSLFDLFNQNWIKKDGKNYARICLGYYTDSLTFVHDKFKCIVILDNTKKEKQLKQQEPLESRFEKHILTYKNILNEDLITKGKNIYSKIKSILKIDLEDNEKKINYKIEELLVNFDYEEILNLIYDESNKNHNLSEDSLSENICKIISRILPQDIIASFNFSKEARKSSLTSTIEKSYFKNEIINIIDFIKNNKSKFSIIYTLSTINEQINEDEENNILAIKINHINTTKEFLQILDDFYEDDKFSILLIKFEGKKSNKIQKIIFIIKNYEKLKNTYLNEKKFIFTCHIKRNFEISNNKKYDISTVSLVSDVNQKFIDDLNGAFKLEDILNKNIINILNYLKLEEITSRYFRKFLVKNEQKKLFEIKDKIKGINNENFIIKIFNWLKEEKQYVVNKINNIILEQIENRGKKIKEYLIKDIFENNKIKNNDIDLISIIKKISIEIFEKYLDNFFKITENNNFLTTIFINSFGPELLCENNQDIISEISDDFYKFKNINNSIKVNPKLIERKEKKGNNNIINKTYNNLNNYINKNSIIKNAIELYFSFIDLNDNLKIDSLNINISFKLPGFFNIFKEMNKYINQNITLNFYLNEKKLRYSLAKDKELRDLKIEFYEKERTLFELTYNKFITFPLIQSLLGIQFEDKSELDEFRDLLIKDYLNLYLRKYYKTKKDYSDEIEYDLILLLLNLRYNEHNELIENIIKENSSKIEKIFKVFIVNIIWIESNKDSILDFIIIYNNLSLIFSNNKLLLKRMKEIINEKKITYVVQEGRNPEHTKEVNKAFYLILSSICYGISSSVIIENYDVEEEYFNFESIENALKIIKRININLLLFSNEVYILTEFIEIQKVLKINEIRENETQIEILKLLNENSVIINNNEFNPNITELKENITKLYNLIDEKIKNGRNYYELLSHIFSEEVKKFKNLDYRIYILKQFILEDNNFIIRSLHILEVIMINILSPNILRLFLNNITNFKSKILLVLEEKSLNNSFLNEMLLYLFEKTSNNYLNSKNKDDEKCFNESLKIFQESINILDDSIKGNKNTNKNIKFLFSVGYIKVFLFRLCHDIIPKAFIENNYKKYFESVITIINNDQLNVNLSSILGLYYNKIIYNKYGKELTNIMEENIQQLYLMNKFKFNQIHCKREREFHLRNYLMPEETKMKEFKNGMKLFYQYQMNDFIGIEDKLNSLINDDINTFYIIISNLLLSKLKEDNYKENKGYLNFGSKYPNFITNQENKKLFDLFCIQNNFNQFIQNYSIIPNEDIIILLHSLRFCLKIINCNDNNIYKNMFNANAKNLIKRNYYPGNDLRNLKIYEVYSKLKAELQDAPDEIGYYICNCEPNGPFLHQVRSHDGFPTSNDKGKCQYCNEKIKYEWFCRKKSTMRERENYFRVFYDDLKKKRAETNMKQKEGNFETLASFKEKYVDYNLRNENKGIIKISKEFFMKEDKYIRDLSQISYRLLNFILFSNLLFASALGYIQRNDLKNYGVEGLTCIRIIENNWEKLKNELSKKQIDIEIFMNMIFNELASILSNIKLIQSYDTLREIEKTIERIIQSKIEINNYNSYKEKYNTHNCEFQYLRGDICSIDNLIPENYEWNEYNREKYPFLKYFYYTENPGEKHIKSLIRNNKEKYPVIDAFLNRNKNELEFLGKLPLFNKFHNLLLNKYSSKITRFNAQKTILKDEDIYKENPKLSEDFIKMWNNIKEKESPQLNSSMPLSDFFIDNENKHFINIYNKFASIQNKILEPLINQKIIKAILPEIYKEKVSIQDISENEIITFKLEKEYISFDNLVLNYSLRNIFNLQDNSINYCNYNRYNIDIDKIEEILSNSFLSNKKLFSNDIKGIIYKNDFYYNKILSDFINNKNQFEELKDDDKKYIITFYSETLNKDLNQSLIFLKEIENLIEQIVENDTGETNINRIINSHDKLKSLKYIKHFFSFNVKDEFKVDKLYNIILFFEKIIFGQIKIELNTCQLKLSEEEKGNISKYFSGNNKTDLLSKEKICIALRRLMTRFIINLIVEEEKEIIKESNENIVKHLYSPDLWDVSMENSGKIKEELNKGIFSLNIYLNKILDFYEEINCEKDDLDFSYLNAEENEKEFNLNDGIFKPNNENPEEENDFGFEDR